MTATITIIVIPAEDPDAFESISLKNRKRESRGWKAFELRSGRFVDTFIQKATRTDLGVFGCEDEEDPETKGLLQTRLLTTSSARSALAKLEKLVEKQPDDTAKALDAHGGGQERHRPHHLGAHVGNVAAE